MTVWERHARDLRRQAELERIGKWILEHPWQSRFLSIGFGVFIFELAQFLRFGLQAFAEWMAR